MANEYLKSEYYPEFKEAEELPPVTDLGPHATKAYENAKRFLALEDDAKTTDSLVNLLGLFTVEAHRGLEIVAARPGDKTGERLSAPILTAAEKGKPSQIWLEDLYISRGLAMEMGKGFRRLELSWNATRVIMEDIETMTGTDSLVSALDQAVKIGDWVAQKVDDGYAIGVNNPHTNLRIPFVSEMFGSTLSHDQKFMALAQANSFAPHSLSKKA